MSDYVSLQTNEIGAQRTTQRSAPPSADALADAAIAAAAAAAAPSSISINHITPSPSAPLSTTAPAPTSAAGNEATRRTIAIAPASSSAASSTVPVRASSDAAAVSGRRRRRWERWRGRDLFLCDGRFKLGASPSGFVCTCFLIFLPFGAHIYYIAEYFSIPVTVLAVVLFFNTVYPLFRCAFADAGIVPRNLSGIAPPAPVGEAGEDETGKRLRFCDTCQVWRGRRVKHCSVCNNCIEAFDHHCPWTGNCIGKRNYRFFVWFVLGVNALSIALAVLSGVEIFEYALSDDNNGNGESSAFWNQLLRAMNKYPIVFGQFLYTVLIWFTVVGLMHYHCDLIADALTTNEKIKEKYKHHPNPYDRGSCCTHWRLLFCSPLPPSQLPDMRAFDDE